MATYRKQYNQKGELINPITKANPHFSGVSKRAIKRGIYNKQRFAGNGKSLPLTISENIKYYRVVQWIFDKKKQIFKRILHYKLAN